MLEKFFEKARGGGEGDDDDSELRAQRQSSHFSLPLIHPRCSLIPASTPAQTRMMASLLSAYFGEDPRDAIYALSYTMIGCGVAAFLALTFVEAPYGKYAEKAAWYYGPPINGKVAWILQECPAFLFPAYFAFKASRWGGSEAGEAVAAELSSLTPRSVLLGMFLLHYFNRSFVYPMRIQGGKPTPLVVALMALCFCICNG